ncbi:50S ribosomal protein L1 [Bdellovibrionota bacterium FG-2]
MSETEKKKRLGHHGKKYFSSLAKLEDGKKYSVEEAFGLLPAIAYAKFDESVEAVFCLGVDPKHSDQMVRGAIVLPNGIGKKVRVAVLAKGEKAKEAEAAGADFVGADDLIEKITGGWMEFDKMIATPDMMVAVSKIGKILGPRGLMPNPKLGTVTFDLAKAVKEQKLGKVEYRTEKAGIIHVGIGKKSFGAAKLQENFVALMSAIMRAKPPTSKGTYLKNITVSTTMSPGISVDPSSALVASGLA